MSKSQFNLKLQQEQQELEISYNNDLLDIAQLCLHNEQAGESGAKLKSNKLDLSAYSYQQNVIDSLKEELASSEKAYNALLVVHNKNAVELDDCKRGMSFKDAKLDELNQSIQMDSIEMNAEIMKNLRKVYSSLMNVNKRLEEEVLKSKAKLNEKNLQFEKLEKKHNDQAKEIHQLLNNIKTSNNENILKNINVTAVCKEF